MPDERLDIKNLSKAELEGAFREIGERPFRAAQVMKWLYKAHVLAFDRMSDLPQELRVFLKKRFIISSPAMVDFRRSPSDGTTKYLLKLEDSSTIETVFLPEKSRNTACLSSQVGCRYGCSFCASSSLGFARHLAVSEILSQVIFIETKNPSSRVTHLVFMGIGEPFDNFDNVMKSIRVFNDPDAFGIGARRITISTCGIIPGIERLKREKLQVELSVSLHAADDELRSKLVPVNKRYPLKELMASCRDYVAATGRIITFEYILIGGVNSSPPDAVRLALLLRGLKCKVNTILFNEIKSKGYAMPTRQQAVEFNKTLRSMGVSVTMRKSRGSDIDAGCGQLRMSRL